MPGTDNNRDIGRETDRDGRQGRWQRAVAHQPEEKNDPAHAEDKWEYGYEHGRKSAPYKTVKVEKSLVSNHGVGWHSAENMGGPKRIFTGVFLVFYYRLCRGTKLLDVMGHKSLPSKINFTKYERGYEEQKGKYQQIPIG